VALIILGLVVQACTSQVEEASPTSSEAAESAAPAASSAPPAAAWEPTGPIELIVQADAGGGSDIFARQIAELLSAEELVTQPINVVNKPGGSGAVAYAYLQQKGVDPQFLATVTLSYLSTPLQQDTGFTYEDFSNLVILAVDDFIAVVPADSPYETLEDVVAAAEASPDEIRVGGTQLGSSDSIIPALIEQAADVEFNYITFESGGEVNAAVLGGTVDFAIANPGEALSLIEGGELRAISSFSPERLEGFDIPTAQEQGFDVTWEQFRGIIAPGGLADEERAYWEDALAQMAESTAWQDYLEQNTLRPLVLTGDEAEDYIAEQSAALEAVLTDLGVIE
jgi:putative tricarboxylic transport membrane protein